ncbi:ATPase synthesis protein 25, mitochondrial [Exophiala dermatitidis]
MQRSPLTSCTACRQSVVDTVTSLVAGISVSRRMGQTVAAAAATRTQRQQQRGLVVPPSPLRKSLHRVQFISPSTTTRSFSGGHGLPGSSLRQQQLSSAASESSQSHGVASGSETSSSVPWYLQVEEPTPPAPISPLLALQEIPPLPADSPAILQPVLEHLSVQIGLDNLVLLDLRHLDPPPALGANLIMVIGTARSVKHLNVSADRFCRWVRKEYKLRPYADGLLGRNELKLKLRRKARKMKLAQSVGNTMAMRDVAMRDGDDGITTGWICVNMGAVDDAVLPDDFVDSSSAEVEAGAEGALVVKEAVEADMDEEVQEEEEEEEEDEYQNPPDAEYVGFGSRPNSPRIVVQMFTEEKRVEMDLEGLWSVRNTRRAHREEKAMAEAGLETN